MTRKIYFFTVMAVLFLLAAPNLRAESGTCGTSLTWTLDDQGVLTIEGTGEMSNYEYMSSPFTSLSFTKAVIKDGVTTIGDYAFAENKGMTSVEIPSSVVKIGTQAFVYCEGLKSVTIPAAVTTIGEMAFLACKGLTKIESLAENPPTCGSNAFYNVDKSKCVLTVPGASVDAYKAKDAWKEFANIEGANSAVASGTCGENLTWTLDSDGVLTIEGTGAMTDYTAGSSPAPWKDLTFTKAVIKDGVTTIGDLAFLNCYDLTSVEIPGSVTSIGAAAFNCCTALTSVTIPNSVTSVGEETFSECTALTSVTLSNSLTSIASGMFAYCSALTGVEIPNSVTSIEKAAFGKCEELTSVTLSNSLKSIVKNAFVYCSKLTSVTFPNTLTSIGSGAFGNCSSLTSVVIPDSVTIIEKNTFLGCSGLKSVTFPNTVTNIGECAFYECEGLTSLTIPASVEGIGDEAFMDCTGLTKIESLSENPPACRNNAFSGVDKNKCVLYVPKKSVDAYKEADEWKYFNTIEGVTNVVAEGKCGDNVTWTLDGNGELTIEGTGAMTDYNSSTPWADLTVTKVVIKDGVTTIGKGAFGANCTGLTSVTIPNSVTSIGNLAFSNCTSLTSVTIPNSVTSIGEWAFGDCRGLTSVTISSSVTSIGTAAFYDCTALEKIESLAKTPPTCGEDVFYGVNTSKCVLYVPKKSVEAYKAADGWKDLTNIEGVTNVVASGECGDNVTWKLDDDGELTFEGTGKMEGYSDGAPWKDMNVTKAVIGDGITNVGNKVFLGCTGLTSVTIPSTVKSIGEAVFYNCQKLTSVEIPDSVTSIGAAAFAACSGLTSLHIPASVTSIGEVAFCMCPGLESITVDAENSTYDSRDNCNAIIEKNTNTLIAGCKNTTIPSTVTSIARGAFYYSTGLKSVTIPASVTSIGEEAFNGCTGLEKIESLAENPPVCGKDVFSDVDKTKCVLYVPKNSVDAYKDADGWKEFANIEALSGGTQSGECGDNVTWTLNGDGVLTIEGTGAMNDYTSESPAPWANLSPTKVVIGDGITTIGNYAFTVCSDLTSVDIPASVTSIGEYAFYGCSGLTSVTIPNSVTSIAPYTFCRCSNLTSMDIPGAVTSIGEWAFYLCEGLTSVTIPASVTSLGDGALAYCKKLEKIECLAENAPTCGNNALYGIDKDKCVLTVPKNSADAYKAADGWKEFTNIATGINGVAQGNGAVVSASNGEITVTGAADNAVVEVYSISGSLVYRGTGKTVTVPSAGIYVVRAAGRTFKVNTAR